MSLKLRFVIAVAAVLLLSAVPSTANPIVEGKQVLYLGGTLKSLPANTMGTFDTTDDEKLIFSHSGGNTAIPYGRMQAFRYERKLARRLGAISTIAVVLVKHRQRRHYLEIDFADEDRKAQTAVFEISKEAPTVLLPVLKTRCPACRPTLYPVRTPYPYGVPPQPQRNPAE